MGETLCIALPVALVVTVIVIVIAHARKPPYHGNGYGKLIGRNGVVLRLEGIGSGFRVEIDGVSWRARSDSSQGFREGDMVVVKGVDAGEMVLVVDHNDEAVD